MLCIFDLCNLNLCYIASCRSYFYPKLRSRVKSVSPTRNCPASGRVLVQGQEFAFPLRLLSSFLELEKRHMGRTMVAFIKNRDTGKWASERTNSEETEQTREVFGPLVTPSSSYDLCFVSLFVPFPLLLLFPFFSLVLWEDRFWDGND